MVNVSEPPPNPKKHSFAAVPQDCVQWSLLHSRWACAPTTVNSRTPARKGEHLFSPRTFQINLVSVIPCVIRSTPAIYERQLEMGSRCQRLGAPSVYNKRNVRVNKSEIGRLNESRFRLFEEIKSWKRRVFLLHLSTYLFRNFVVFYSGVKSDS